MVAHAIPNYISPEDYLALEVECESKNEYVDGLIVAMAGGSPEHITITMNLTVELLPRLRRTDCRGFATQMRVRLNNLNRYYYPDYVAVCKPPLFEDIRGVKSLTNPTVIFEVLSESTERRDRGEKWLAYSQMDTLTGYLLIHQDGPLVESYHRNLVTGTWEFTRVSGLRAVLPIPSLECEVALADLYYTVEFEPPSLEPQTSEAVV